MAKGSNTVVVVVVDEVGAYVRLGLDLVVALSVIPKLDACFENNGLSKPLFITWIQNSVISQRR